MRLQEGQNAWMRCLQSNRWLKKEENMIYKYIHVFQTFKSV